MVSVDKSPLRNSNSVALVLPCWSLLNPSFLEHASKSSALVILDREDAVFFFSRLVLVVVAVVVAVVVLVVVAIGGGAFSVVVVTVVVDGDGSVAPIAVAVIKNWTRTSFFSRANDFLKWGRRLALSTSSFLDKDCKDVMVSVFLCVLTIVCKKKKSSLL